VKRIDTTILATSHDYYCRHAVEVICGGSNGKHMRQGILVPSWLMRAMPAATKNRHVRAKAFQS
jgi:hypothetical protein